MSFVDRGKVIAVMDIREPENQRASRTRKADSYDGHVVCEMEDSRRSVDRMEDDCTYLRPGPFRLCVSLGFLGSKSAFAVTRGSYEALRY